MAIISALPFALVLVAVCFSLLRVLREEEDRVEHEALAFRHALRQWMSEQSKEN